MADLDPLTGNIEQLDASLTRRATASLLGGAVTVEVGADGSLHAIRVTEMGRSLDLDTLLDSVVRLHAVALEDARQSVAVAITRIENDPRLRAQRERTTDTLAQPLPRKPAPEPPAKTAAPQQFTGLAPDPWATPGRKTTPFQGTPQPSAPSPQPPSPQRPQRNTQPADWDEDDEYFERKRRDGWFNDPWRST
ncbi:hypothetical protein [Nocardia arthritidis]|uniref:YbaB/EbfC family DNA-binding protein n=1 Tax=Nocardia arthritidis TaxID=228602 RepID=A0A6G9Y6V7_9NOCA|nr:hypothetical protein [Nocardia arthritidis]QIS08806.1 hypothetical protein F5544_04460 [Nocardia arthritidis]